MMTNALLITGIAVLASGTFLLRFAGFRLGSRIDLSPRVRQLLADAAIVLLLAVAATSTLYQDAQFAGAARLIGVLTAVFFAWRRAPPMVIVLAAALVTALLRQAGVS